MAEVQLLYLCIVLALFTINNSSGSIGSNVRAIPAPKIAKATAPANVYLCGVCGQPITVSLIVRNNLKSPFFEFQVQVKAKPQREFIYFLQDAAKMDPRFKFSADFYPSLGFLVTSINGLSGSVDEKTYWEIINHPTGNNLLHGASSYVPSDGEVLAFNFTTWDDTSL